MEEQGDTVYWPTEQLEHVWGALEPPTQKNPPGHAENDAPLKYWPGGAPVKQALLPTAETIPELQGMQVPFPGP